MERSLSCCRDCSKWEKHTYWTRFRLVQFFTHLPEEPCLQLGFPRKFLKNLKEELSESVVLYGPSGHTWNVGLMRSGSDLFLKYGWQEFVNAHNLKHGDVLFFRYHGESRFDVLIFDQSNSCEKESSYFVRKCSNTDQGCSKLNGKRKERGETSIPPKKQRSEGAVNDRPQSPVCGGVKATAVRRAMVSKLDKGLILSHNQGCRKLNGKRKERGETSIPSKKTRIEEATPVRRAVVSKLDKDDEDIYDDLNPSYYLHFVSKRRPVTEAEKSRAQERADRVGARSKMPHFVIVMQPTNVSYRFHLTIPIDIVRSYFPHKDEDTILSVEGKNWPAKFIYSVRGGSGFDGLQWGDFVQENNLEVGDVCLFELSGQDKITKVINVSIFRVVEEVVPLKKVTINTKMKRRAE